ncbi:hypothetical protein [Pseudonocardia humida]|uniref:DUF3039 domain-containing protein n=1 Tax=Pseudonocardia humida TaxID=2800819 RepID=A0ABT1A7Z2_9PSEU|nr:hypothetical protein [Pseudonocardia humida]MCO1659142.1 hypothetical protein [Pseudonocardia humida]
MSREHRQSPRGQLFDASINDARQPAPIRPPSTTIRITCLTDGLAHDVPDAQLAAAANDRAGCYIAVCGHVVTAASMVEPDGKRCSLCDEVFGLNRPPRRRRFF